MGTAYICDLCGALFPGYKPMTIMVKYMHPELGHKESWKDVCVECGRKIKGVIEVDVEKTNVGKSTESNE